MLIHNNTLFEGYVRDIIFYIYRSDGFSFIFLHLK